MKDQHEKIKGYRNLSEMEIELMNDVKVLEAKFLKLVSPDAVNLEESQLNIYKGAWGDQLKEIGAMRQAETDALLEGCGNELSLDQLNQSKRCLNESRRNLRLINLPVSGMDLEITAAINQMAMWAIRAVALPDALEV